MTTTISREMTVRDVLSQFAPRNQKLNPNSERSHWTTACPIHNDAQHRDYSGSFSIHANDQLWRCFGPCGGGNARRLYEILSGNVANYDPGYTQPPPRQAESTRSKPRAGPIVEFQGATIDELVASKPGWPAKLTSYVRETLGWRDGRWGRNTKAIEMPYFGEDGKEEKVRYRTGITGDNRFRAKGKQILYGLWNLADIRERGAVWIVEGETDFAVFSYHDFPVLAVPGASSYQHKWSSLLEGVQVYGWEEPASDKEQEGTATAGQGLMRKLAASFPNLLVVKAPEDAKDPCELFQKVGDDFVARIENLIDEAAPFIVEAPAPRFDDREEGSWFTAHDQVRFRLWIDALKDDAMMKKQLFVDTLPAETVNQRLRKNRIDRCFDSYRTRKCLNTGEIFLQRFKCNEPVCPFCSHGLLEQFFNQPGPDGQCKKDTVKAYMDDPTIYAVNLGSYKLPSDHVQKVKCIAAIEKEILAWNTRLTDNHGKDYAMAKDHIRGIRVKTEGDVFHYQLLFLANREGAAALEILRQHFARSTGVVPKVEEYTCHGVNNAVEMFTLMMGLRCDWDTAENYDLWRAATKGSKLIQGKGIYYKVSGGKKPKQLGLKLGDCPICGTCTPVDLGTSYPVASTQVEHIESEWTGKRYLVLKSEAMVA